MSERRNTLYRGRRLLEGYPGLGERALETYQETVEARPTEFARIEANLLLLDRLIDVRSARNILVVGCGPQPEALRVLREMGFKASGVEPVPAFAAAARGHLGEESSVVDGSAEDLPTASGSQDVVFLESVLEHVDSVPRALEEVHRVLVPGGIAFIITTNRRQLALRNAEFNLPFYHWLPNVVKESYVFRHLHYDPSLANYTERPAVHWFTYAELCELGRVAGFFQFYSRLDLKVPEESNFSGGRLMRRVKSTAVAAVQRSAWARALALTQVGGQILMVKRP